MREHLSARPEPFSTARLGSSPRVQEQEHLSARPELVDARLQPGQPRPRHPGPRRWSRRKWTSAKPSRALSRKMRHFSQSSPHNKACAQQLQVRIRGQSRGNDRFRTTCTQDLALTQAVFRRSRPINGGIPVQAAWPWLLFSFFLFLFPVHPERSYVGGRSFSPSASSSARATPIGASLRSKSWPGLPPKAGCESRPTVGQRWAACGARRKCATHPT